MKYLFLITIIFLLKSFPSFSEIIKLNCKYGDVGIYFKIDKGSNGTLVSFRDNSEWVKWCTNKYDKLEIKKGGAVCKIEYNLLGSSLLKRYQISNLDFELKILEITTFETKKFKFIKDKINFRCEIIK